MSSRVDLFGPSGDAAYTAGDTVEIVVGLTDRDGNPLPLGDVTGATWSLFARATHNDEPTGEALVTKTLGVGIRREGETLVIRIDGPETAGLAGIYVHELETISPAGTFTTPWGRFHIRRGGIA